MRVARTFSTPLFSEYQVLDEDRIVGTFVRTRQTETDRWSPWEVFVNGESRGEAPTRVQAARMIINQN